MIVFPDEKKFPRLNAIARPVCFWIFFVGLLYVVGSRLQVMPEQFARIWYGIICLAVAGFATWLFLKLERRSFSEIGLAWEKGTATRFIRGLFAGVILFALILAMLIGFSSLKLEQNPRPFAAWTLLWYLAVLPLAFMEEIAFRAYPFRKLNDGLAVWPAQLISAAAFALYHIANGWDPATAFLGPGIWGLVFGLATLRSGGIAMATGIHTAVNIMQPLFGMGGDKRAIFLLTQPSGTTGRTESIGTIIQIILLLGALMLTFRYARAQRHRASAQ